MNEKSRNIKNSNLQMNQTAICWLVRVEFGINFGKQRNSYLHPLLSIFVFQLILPCTMDPYSSHPELMAANQTETFLVL